MTFDDTIGTRVGNEQTQDAPDGFLLQGNCSSLSTCQVVVFVGRMNAEGCRHGASAAAAGFTVDSNMATRAAEAILRTVSTSECPAAPDLVEGAVYGDVVRSPASSRLPQRARRSLPRLRARTMARR